MMRSRQEGLGRDAYYGLAGKIVRMLAPETEAPPPALLLNLLVLFGNRIGPTHTLLHNGVRHPARLNLMVVGPTTTGRKGTGTNLIYSVMLEHPEIEGEPEKILGLSSGEGLIAALQHYEQVGRPWIPVIEEEFASTLKVLRREGNPLSGHIRSLFDKGEARVQTRRDPLRVDNAHVSIIGNITPPELERELGAVELSNGFATRFLWCYSERWHELQYGGNPPLGKVRRLLEEAMDRAWRVDPNITWSEPALAEWGDIYSFYTNRPRTGAWEAVSARVDQFILRAAIIYALLDGTSVISVEHLDAAQAVGEYADGIAARLFGISDPGRRILKALAALGNETTKRELQRKLGKQVDDAEDLDRGLKELAIIGVVVENSDAGGKKGRPRSPIVRRR